MMQENVSFAAITEPYGAPFFTGITRDSRSPWSIQNVLYFNQLKIHFRICKGIFSSYRLVIRYRIHILSKADKKSTKIVRADISFAAAMILNSSRSENDTGLKSSTWREARLLIYIYIYSYCYIN
jgi:hypothetical protein